MDMVMSGNNSRTRLFSMEGRDHHHHHQETNDTAGSSSSASENGSDNQFPPSSTPIFHVTTTASSPKKSGSRRSVQKRVVTIPIKEMEGNSRLKGDTCHISTPPSDSWAWRKYGQKPIKGSPYPRGYYRCSSSKGCPARKQVERSRVDPTMLLVTYAADHNHPWPAASSRNNHNHAHIIHSQSSTATSKPLLVKKEDEAEELEEKANNDVVVSAAIVANDRFVGHVDDGAFSWFGDHHMDAGALESPVFVDGASGACDHALLADVFPMGEEDASLFADLGELPECSFVFRHRGVGVGPQVEIF